MTSLRFLLVVALSSTACGGVVAPAEPDPVFVPPTSTVASATCAEVRATCGDAPHRVVRGHASGLVGVDGARVTFAVRYLKSVGDGLDVPHGVVASSTTVSGSAFEACVCVPENTNMYPEIAAVVFAKGSVGDTSREVARASYSQRYATLGDEDVGYALNDLPSAARKEAALAALVERTLSVTLRELAAVEDARIYGGVVADERPVAAQITSAVVTSGGAMLTWNMPGRAYPSERLALFVDRNGDGTCDAGDVAAFVRLDAGTDVSSVAWRTDVLDAVCAAVAPGVDRGV